MFVVARQDVRIRTIVLRTIILVNVESIGEPASRVGLASVHFVPWHEDPPSRPPWPDSVFFSNNNYEIFRCLDD